MIKTRADVKRVAPWQVKRMQVFATGKCGSGLVVEFTVRNSRKASALGVSTLEWCLLRRFLVIPNQCFERGLPSLNALNDNLGG